MSGTPIVIKLGGLAVEDPQRAGPLLDALAALHRGAPGRVVIVHGGGKAVDEHLARLGIVSERREGLRVTSDAEIAEVAAVLAGKVNKALSSALLARGVRAAGMCIGDGATCLAERHAPRGVDLGRVGRVTGGDASMLRAMLAGGLMPVLAPIAYDASGGLLNINGDDAAAGVARVVGAGLLVLLTDVPGVLNERREVIASLDATQIDALIAGNVITGGMIPKVRAALEASRTSGAAALIASWNDPGAIRALAASTPAGTIVRAQSHADAPVASRSLT